MNEREFQDFFGPQGFYSRKSSQTQDIWRDWSGYRTNCVGYNESSLLLPKDKEVQKCIKDLLTQDEEEWLPKYAEDVQWYFASKGGMWKNIWKKRAARLAIFRKHTEARRPQHANTD